eukprot:TRINITY_DN11506_c0_g1_i2.p1 TRINITY_DN11506_c0_g1~~TRINITY_DN11506_c0_g1_i2.p1  ORF type:complete len:123 (-),score=17.28 TRINITY_DN11506_c0_g1_i2:32-400(-)
MTIKLSSTYKTINKNLCFKMFRRVLTYPNEPDPNNYPFDNCQQDYILYVHDEIIGPRKRYVILDPLGTGSFGQVVKCQEKGTNREVAVKVIRNHPAYHTQGLLEIKILEDVCFFSAIMLINF